MIRSILILDYVLYKMAGQFSGHATGSLEFIYQNLKFARF